MGWDSNNDKQDYSKVIEKFGDELSGETRVVLQSYLFWDYCRSEQQPFDDYLSILRQMFKRCYFAENYISIYGMMKAVYNPVQALPQLIRV